MAQNNLYYIRDFEDSLLYLLQFEAELVLNTYVQNLLVLLPIMHASKQINMLF